MQQLPDLNVHYTGHTTAKVSKQILDDIVANKRITYHELDYLYENEYVLLINEEDPNDTICGKKEEQHIRLVSPKAAYGIKPRNTEQIFAMDALLDDRIPYVVISGIVGGGKTLLALAAAMAKREKSKSKYEKIIMTKPMTQIGRHSLGTLPGEINEKFNPYLINYESNFKQILGRDVSIEDVVHNYRVEFRPLQLFLGASFTNTFIIVDECFPFKQYINTSIGKKYIGVLHNMFQQGKEMPLILSYNEETKQEEWVKITNTWKRDPKQLLEIKCSNQKIRCTPEHKFFTTNGWQEAQNLIPGSILLGLGKRNQHVLSLLGDDQKQLSYGLYLGDGSFDKVGLNRYRIKVIHGQDQQKYLEWLSMMFNTKSEYIEKNGYSQKPAYMTQTLCFASDQEFLCPKTTCPQWILDNIDARGLAIWFADNGSLDQFNATFQTCSFDIDSQERIISMLKQKFDIHAILSWSNKNKEGKIVHYPYLRLNKEDMLKLQEIIGPYMPESMSYKSRFYTKEYRYNWNNSYASRIAFVVDKVEMSNKIEPVYDIEVEKNHNFIICSKGQNTSSGIIVHNCQGLDYKELGAISTRLGEGSKIVLMGDYGQLHERMDRSEQGMRYVVESEAAKNSPLVAVVELSVCERSPIAALMGSIFKN